MPPPFDSDEFARRLAASVPGMLLLRPLVLRRLLRRLRRAFGADGLPTVRAGACVRLTQLQLALGEIATAPPLPAGLPERTIVLAWPPPRLPWTRRDPRHEAGRLLREAYRQLLRRHLIEAQPSAGDTRSVLESLGPAAWPEAVAVLRRDGRLQPPFTAATALREFLTEAALAVQLGPGIGDWFPSCPQNIGDLLRRQFGDDLSWKPFEPFAAELATAAQPPIEASLRALHSSPLAFKSAEAARNRGNLVRALLLTDEPGDRREFGQRLARALSLPSEEIARWGQWLDALVRCAKSDPRGAAARCLFDLQKVCVGREKSISTVDFIGWLRFPGQLSVTRLLPLAPDVQAIKSLRSALGRLPGSLLSSEHSHAACEALQKCLRAEEAHLRFKLEPALADVLPGAGLKPQNLPERMAHAKVRAELIDRIVENGRLAFSDVRDAISRNELKLPDLAGPMEFFRGDALLRADRALALRLDGIYHAGEAYLRWFQSLSSLAFGTGFGRLFSRYFAIPFGGAFMLLEFLQHMLGPLLGRLFGLEPHLVSRWTVLAAGLTFLAILHWPAFRGWVWKGLRSLGRGLRWAFLTMPLLVYIHTPLKKALNSAPAKWLLRTFFAPTALTLLFSLSLFAADVLGEWNLWLSGGAFLLLTFICNSGPGRWIGEQLADMGVRSWDLLRVDFLPGLIRFIADLFRTLSDWSERGLYAVDEWLRYRQGDPKFSIFLKGSLGLFWFVATYLFRFAWRLLVEPQINPLKHFPVVTVSHKLLLPTIPAVARLFRQLLPNHALYADSLATGLVFGIPGVFGFLAWELKENWRLYAASRPRRLEPQSVGHHGETVRRLLRPGFHSGTIPAQFARRRAVADGRARPSLAAKAERELHHVEEAMRRLVEREFLAFLAASRRWKRPTPTTAPVHLTTNQIEVELKDDAGKWSIRLAWFDELLHAELALPAGLDLQTAQRETLALALAGLWARIGVERPTFSAPLWEQWTQAWQERLGKNGALISKQATALLAPPVVAVR